MTVRVSKSPKICLKQLLLRVHFVTKVSLVSKNTKSKFLCLVAWARKVEQLYSQVRYSRPSSTSDWWQSPTNYFLSRKQPAIRRLIYLSQYWFFWTAHILCHRLHMLCLMQLIFRLQVCRTVGYLLVYEQKPELLLFSRFMCLEIDVPGNLCITLYGLYNKTKCHLEEILHSSLSLDSDWMDVLHNAVGHSSSAEIKKNKVHTK